MNDYEKIKEDRIKKAIETFKFCMEYDDPRLDKMVWMRTLPRRNPNAIMPYNYNEPVSVRRAILAVFF